MSVLIRGEEVPERCDDCIFLYLSMVSGTCQLRNNKKVIEGSDGRPEWCPLEEVPEFPTDETEGRTKEAESITEFVDDFLNNRVHVVRCKDCKHRPLRGKNKWANVCAPRVMASEYEQHRTVEDETCPFLCDDPFYSEIPPDDFFCAYGEQD